MLAIIARTIFIFNLKKIFKKNLFHIFHLAHAVKVYVNEFYFDKVVRVILASVYRYLCANSKKVK